MKIEQLNALASEMIGDNGDPNVFFVTLAADVVLITVDFQEAYDKWFALSRRTGIESALEDRKTGVICSMQRDEEINGHMVRIDDSKSFGFRN